MPNDIEQLKQDFLAYLSVLVFPSPEILVSKMSTVFQETKLSKIEIKPDNSKILSISSKNKDKCDLTKSELGDYGLSIEDFIEYIKDIKNKNPKITLLEAIKEILNLHNKKLCKIYVSQAILAYTDLYGKFKLENPKKTSEEIYSLMYSCFLEKITSRKLAYNCLSFTMAYQCPPLETDPSNPDIELAAESHYYLNILNTVKNIQLTPFRNTYINLLDSIKELCSLQVKDKNASNDLAAKLKDLTKSCFLELIQATFYEQTEKFTYEKKITEKFQKDCKQLIEKYQNEHPDEFKKQRSILNRILWLIGRFIPSSILSKEKKMTLFGDKATNNTKKFTEINIQVDQLASSNYFRRVISTC
jgi:hypothetical protein